MSKEDFYSLTPDQVLHGVEAAGFLTTGSLLQLNSYENRVYEVTLENDSENVGKKIIAKFYRPGRWDEATILEEHEFLAELLQLGIPAVAPLRHKDNVTLRKFNNMWLALFPKARGRLVQELTHPELKRLGRMLAQTHNVGAKKKFKHRPQMDPLKTARETLKLIEPHISPDLFKTYTEITHSFTDFLDTHLDKKNFVRIHGDCHKGNILETDPAQGAKEYFLIDFDDTVMGPPAQDFWMLFSGDEHESAPELEALLSGYLELRELKSEDLEILPALRALRIIYYAGWIARRWEDPSFPKLFPQFRDYDYWRDEIERLEDIADTLSL
jgi:Ser/Thr protein kinase RdoA (MazF antagonist)